MIDSPNPKNATPITISTIKESRWGKRLINIAIIIGAMVIIFAFLYYLILFAVLWLNTPNYEFTPEYSPADFETELGKNQTKWESLHITHYQMVLDPGYSSDNYGHTPLVIEVKDGEVISVIDAQGNRVSFEDEQSFAYSDRELFTVPGLFSYVHRTFFEKPPRISVTYDAIYGYPESIFVDPYVEPCCQDYSIDLLDFHVLP